MGFLDELSQGWVWIKVTGTVPHGEPRTYVRYNHQQLPLAPVYLDSWDWLRTSAHPNSALGQAQEQAIRDLTPHALTELLTPPVLPGDFARFVADPELRTHLRSATSCHFHLANHLEPVPGGVLLHLISDSQWTMHWLLYLGTGGASAVVATARPIGFVLDDEEATYWDSEGWEYVRCAAPDGTCWSRPRRMLRAMTVKVTVQNVEPTPTAVVAAAATWAEFPTMWGAMLDTVWSFLRGDGPEGLYKDGHNIMLYKDDVPNVEVGVQVSGSFASAGHVVASTLPGGLAATATHTGPIAKIGDTHQAVCEWSKANGYRLAGPRWEIYGDPDPATGDFDVDVFWSLVAP